MLKECKFLDNGMENNCLLKYNLNGEVVLLYPNSIKKKQKNNITYANRGMDLEFLINEANSYYINNDIAIIYKRPTPIQISKVKFTSGKPEVTKGLFNQKSTLDYVGVYKGKYIDFDAKKTLNKTSFPIDNIHEHQIKHIKRVIDHGGLSFLIIEINEGIYLLPGDKLIEFINTNTRKSIPKDYIIKNSCKIEFGYAPVLDYIKAIEMIYFKKENL